MPKATVEFKRCNHGIFFGGIVVTLPPDTKTIAFMNSYDYIPPRPKIGQPAKLSPLARLMGCSRCPVFQKNISTADRYAQPDYGNRNEESGKASTLDIICAGHSHQGAKMVGSETKLPCVATFTRPKKVIY